MAREGRGEWRVGEERKGKGRGEKGGGKRGREKGRVASWLLGDGRRWLH